MHKDSDACNHVLHNRTCSAQRFAAGTSSLGHAAGKSDVPQKPIPIQMQGPARCTQCGQQLGPWHDLAGRQEESN